jgi:hypothetical protein
LFKFRINFFSKKKRLLAPAAKKAEGYNLLLGTTRFLALCTSLVIFAMALSHNGNE